LAPPRHEYTSIENILPGRVEDTPHGQTFVVEQHFPGEELHGKQEILLTASLQGIAAWLNEPKITETPIEDFCFLDTETSGLSGGTGTYAFLVGIGRFQNNQFRLAQFFMRDPSEELAQLLALEAFLGSSKILVSFNGKAFDVPLLNSRYILHGWQSPLRDLIQIDLLHLARRLWRNHLPSRALGNLEVEILGIQRSSDEVPGWMIPQLYFDYLRSGDARPMKNVFYHNTIDVLSMATLLNRMAELISNPLQVDDVHKNELAALGSIYEDLGDFAQAVQLYEFSIKDGEWDDNDWNTLQRLSFLHKRMENFEKATILWETAAKQGHIYAHIELAKYYEHRMVDYTNAMEWTNRAINLLNSPNGSIVDQVTWLQELNHRLDRLKYKISRSD